MRHIVFTPDRNKISNDYVGAFEPEALRYASYWAGQGDEVAIHKMPPMSAERSVLKMLEVIEAAGAIDRLVFFCHGWKTGIQMGLSCGDDKGRDALATFCTRLVAASTPQLKVALYACSTGASSTSVTGDGGFADALRDVDGRPVVCSASSRWEPAGDRTCASVGAVCVVDDGGPAHCAPAVDAGADGGAE